MIQAEGLTKYYGSLKAIEDVSFVINRGETVGLLGPNGAGKTTTMRLLTGFMPPTAGGVRIAGYDLFDQAREAKSQIGYLPEHPPLYPELTLTEYLSFVARLHGIPRLERGRHIDEAIERVQLGSVRRRPIGQLSKGYQQRVGLAQVLVKKPKVLILDEPTIGLDPKQIIEIRKLIKELAGDYTIVLSSHILQEVSVTCERVIIIHEGKIVAQDTQEELLRQASGDEWFRIRIKGPDVSEAERSFGQINGIEEVRGEAVNGLVTLHIRLKKGHDCREPIFYLLKEKNWIPYEIASEETTLEEVFLKLTEDSGASEASGFASAERGGLGAIGGEAKDL